MKINLRVFIGVLALECVLFYCPLLGDVVDKFLTEPSETSALVESIEKILSQVGCTSLGASMSKQEKNAEKQYISIPAKNMQKSIPDDIEACKKFLHDLRDGVFNQGSYESIKDMCKDFEEGDLLAFVINQLLINKIQIKLGEHYIKNHPEVEAKKLEKLLEPVVLDMCECVDAPLAKRFALILYVVKEIKQKFKETDHIVITSLGSGGMLMEYLLASALKYVGYTAMTVNVIDLAYKHIDEASSAKILSDKLNLETHFCISGKIDSASTGAVNVFDSGFDYIKTCEKNALLKSTVMIAVDLGGKAWEVPFSKPFSPDINRVEISIKRESERNLFVYMMHYGKPRIYWDRLCIFNKKFQAKVMDEVAQMAQKLEKDRLSDINSYRSSFISNLVDILHRSYTEGNLLPEIKKTLNQKLRKLLPENKLNLVVDEISADLVTKKDLSPVTISAVYLDDPYALLQELVIDGLCENGQAFMFDSDSLIRIDVEFLKKTGGYSLFEKYGDKKRRCILRSPEFIEQQL